MPRPPPGSTLTTRRTRRLPANAEAAAGIDLDDPPDAEAAGRGGRRLMRRPPDAEAAG